MHKNPKTEADGPETPETVAEKKLTEALLGEHTRAGAEADEEFVAGVEQALDDAANPADFRRLAELEEFPASCLPVSSPGRSSSRHTKTTAWSVAVLVHIVIVVVLCAIYIPAYRRDQQSAEIVAVTAAPADHLVTQLQKKQIALPPNIPVPDASKVRVDPHATVPGLKAKPAPRALVVAINSSGVTIAPGIQSDDYFGKSFSPSNTFYSPASQGGSDPAGIPTPEGNSDASRTPEADAPPVDRERYGELVDNRWLAPYDYPLSTFSIDVDTAAYTNLRRMIRDRVAIPKDAVRIEEIINYFDYDYPEAEGEHPFAFAIETASCPWNEDHRLVRIGLKGKSIARDHRPRANLVFLLDVSGSMDDARKLPLLVDSMKILVEELNSDDVVSIVVYAGAEGLALSPTPGGEKTKILGALDRLKAGGSTNGGAGIQLAYKTATENFIEDGVNRVILCTDGDFNVGRTVQGDLVDMVKERASGGTFLSVLGFGTGNINDSMLESITNKGNGNYFYIDSIAEGRKVLLEDLMSTLVTIAKDVKIQVEFNPEKVGSYRLIGYANRMLEAEDFDDDTVDAGEVGAGHRVTALYEIIPASLEEVVTEPVPELRYQKARKTRKTRKTRVVPSEELLTVKLRYKEPDSDVSKKLEVPVVDGGESWRRASDDFQFSSAVALFGMILRDSKYIGDATLVRVIEAAAFAKNPADPHRRREEFRELVSLKIASP